jgi:hypothetical protein
MIFVVVKVHCLSFDDAKVKRKKGPKPNFHAFFDAGCMDKQTQNGQKRGNTTHFCPKH